MEWNKWNRLIDIECINYYFFIYCRYNTNTIHIYFFFLGWPNSWKYKFFLFDCENRSHRLVDVYRITVESMNFFLFVSMRLHIRCHLKLRVSFVFNINMDFKSIQFFEKYFLSFVNLVDDDHCRIFFPFFLFYIFKLYVSKVWLNSRFLYPIWQYRSYLTYITMFKEVSTA